MANLTISLTPGGDPVHVTVTDENGNAIDPAQVHWDDLPNLPHPVSGGGFDFSAASACNPGTYTNKATYNGPLNPAPVIGPDLTINVLLTALQYTSP